MKPEYLPRLSEKVAGGVGAIGVFFMIAAFVAMQVMPHTFNGMVAGLAEAGRLWVIGMLLILGSLIAMFTLSKERHATIKYDTEAMRRAAMGPPVMSETSTGNSIVVFQWSIDLASHTRAQMSMLRGRLMGPRFALVMIIMIIAVSCTYILRNMMQSTMFRQINNLTFLACVIGAVSVYMALVIGSITLATRQALRIQYAYASVQNYGLVMDRDGLKLIAGNIVNEVPWKIIRSIVEIQGVVFIHAIPWQQTIPSYAFHSAGDAKAFAVTATALKRRKPVPVHDWSGYTGIAPTITPTTDGSWPPAISSEN